MKRIACIGASWILAAACAVAAQTDQQSSAEVLAHLKKLPQSKPFAFPLEKSGKPALKENPIPEKMRYKNKLDWHMVAIEALVVEVNEERTRQLGFTYGLSQTSDSSSLDGANVSLGSQKLGLTSVPLLATSPDGSTSISFADRMPGLGISLSGIDVDSSVVAAQLRMLLDRGEAVIRTRPIGVALNKTEVSIETVDEIPYVDLDSKGKLVVAKKAAGVKLKVTPTIVPDHPGAVTLDISNIEISTASSFITLQNINRPVLNVSKTHTKITLREGETFIIGGLKTRRKAIEEDRIPILGRIPMIKWLFTSRNEVERNMDVLFFITPNILAPGENFLLPYDFKNQEPLGLNESTNR
ncbi:type II secretion system protein GspD [Pontiella sulfatireligans]|uniref:Type IV pilus biogenesis and competence protein PilQ n=1 Tax=Pontiella sulfatireligans TaxID=2750658 RepID=A0A6C2UMG7_9BACT|nr:type II and III secretion system protein [Pontiella sulfatireligans]VGO21318.1 Type IV pilus biogenesis and competence protein PilQ [Pontiella sulfatireligans]